MKKLLLLSCMLILSVSIFAQSIIVNRYFNSASSDGTGDVAELVVVTDHTTIKKWIIKDYGNGTSTLDDGGGKFRFNDIPLWNNLRSGTVIVIRKLTTAQLAAYTPDTDPSDFVLDVAINDTNLFTDLSASGKTWNLTPHEMVLIKSDVVSTTGLGENDAVYALGYGDFKSKATWNGVKSPKAIFSNGDFNTTNYVANGTIGQVALTNPNVANYTTPLTKSNPLITLPSYWNKESTLTSNMPYGIEIYHTTTDYSLNSGPSRKMNAYCVIVDPKYVDFKPTFSSTNKTPTSFVTDESGTVLACINAGFFSSTQALSMLRYNGTPYSYNPTSVTRTYQGNNTTYYPTRATFGLSPDLTPSVTWTYNQNFTVYSYSTPSPNDVNNAPQPAPTTTGGVVWNNVTAVGGSPMLIKNGIINITSTEELIDVDNTSARARTAIGHNASGKIVMVSIEGENTGVSDGLTLEELANYMKDMGCTGALSLDGGGSTVLRVNNQEMIRPSASGVERAMPGVILIKSKN